MSKTKKSKSDTAVIGYEKAIDLWIHYSEEGWHRFSFMLGINTLLLSSYYLIISSNGKPYPFDDSFYISIIPLIVGFSLSVLWIFISRRSIEYSKYFILSAKEFEQKYFKKNIQIISRGGDFSSGKTVFINLNGEDKCLKLSWFGKPKASFSIMFIVLIFIMIYISLIAFSLHP